MYQSKFKNKAMDELFQAILTLESVEDCYRFFEDIATIQELKDFAMRLQVAKQLHDEVNYSEIIKSTGASSATISRVNRALNYGADGYKLIIKNIKK
jgi:TrpR-related protein YerC/YecD